jgi:hypothetical protein
MLKITVELFPGGREEGRRVLATADISRIKSGKVADYDVSLEDGALGSVGTATLRDYPRYSVDNKRMRRPHEQKRASLRSSFCTTAETAPRKPLSRSFGQNCLML